MKAAIIIIVLSNKDNIAGGKLWLRHPILKPSAKKVLGKKKDWKLELELGKRSKMEQFKIGTEMLYHIHSKRSRDEMST